MRAVVLAKEGVVIKDVAKPSVGPDQVLVAVKACSLNRADLMTVNGTVHGGWGWTEDAPLGMEYAGEVVEVGSEVTTAKVGDRVAASAGAGAFAEYVVGHPMSQLKLPDNMSYEDGTALPVALNTMHDAIVVNGGIEAGQTILIQGASSGVGLIGMQIAKYKGATVIGTSNDPERCKMLLDNGADFAVNTNDADWVEQVLKCTPEGKGVDMLVDFIAGPFVNGGLEVTKVGGIMINIGRLAGESGEFNFDLHNMKRIRYIGLSWRMRTPLESLTCVMKAREDMFPAMEQGLIKMPIDSVYPLEKAADAFAKMSKNEHFGKLVLTV